MSFWEKVPVCAGVYDKSAHSFLPLFARSGHGFKAFGAQCKSMPTSLRKAISDLIFGIDDPGLLAI